MNTKEKLENQLKEAMRSGDQMRKQTIRLALSSIKLAEIDQGKPLDENKVLAILQKEIKTHQETLENAEKGGRMEIVEENRLEIEILEEFLPKQLSEEEIRTIAEQVIESVQAKDMKDMGKVMKEIMPKIQGRAPNDKVSQIIRQILGNG
jgi:uncharacterized protein YqeY